MSDDAMQPYIIRMLAERIEQVSRELALAAFSERYCDQLNRIAYDLRDLLPDTCPNCHHRDSQHTLGYCQALGEDSDLCGCPITRGALDVVRRVVLTAREGTV